MVLNESCSFCGMGRTNWTIFFLKLVINGDDSYHGVFQDFSGWAKSLLQKWRNKQEVCAFSSCRTLPLLRLPTCGLFGSLLRQLTYSMRGETIGYFVILSVTLLLWSSSPYAISTAEWHDVLKSARPAMFHLPFTSVYGCKHELAAGMM